MNNLCLVHWQYTWPTFAHVCSLILFEVCLSRLGSIDRENVYTYIRAYLHAWDCMCMCGYGCAVYVQEPGGKECRLTRLAPIASGRAVDQADILSAIWQKGQTVFEGWRGIHVCVPNDTWSCWTWTSCWDHEECHQSAHGCNRCQRNSPSVTLV